MTLAVNASDSTILGSNQNTGSLTATSAADMQNNFLTLLVAQLKNQDPTNPMDNSQLTSQLAQISTVSGIEKLNTTLGAISGQIDDSQQLQTATLVGHGVMIPGQTVLAGNGSTSPFGIELEQAAEKVTAVITDSSGIAVRTLDLDKQSAGVHTFSWDGTQTDGTPVPDGAYTVNITATTNNAQQVVQPLNFALVQGITRTDSGSALDLGTYGTITLDKVRQII